MVLPAPYSAPRISRAVKCPRGTPVRTLQYSLPHKHAPGQQESTHTARQAMNRWGSVWWVSVVRTRRGASFGRLPDEPLTWRGGVRGWHRLRAIGGGVAVESPLSARNGSSIDDRDDMFEKSTLVSRRTHTRSRGLLHGAPLLYKRIATEHMTRPRAGPDFTDSRAPVGPETLPF